MSAHLQVDGLTAGYHGKPVLREVTLDVAPGQLVLLLGPNGHGKTTLLRCISGLTPLMAGAIRFDGSEVAQTTTERLVGRGLVHIPQGDMVFTDMTVLENLMMGAYLANDRQEVEARLAQVYALIPKLEARKSQIAASLSGGERRMLAIGRGIMANARMMLIDEPSLGLAPIIIDQIYDIVADLKARGLSILLVEENASRALGLADEVHLLDNGRISWRGKPADVTDSNEIFDAYLGG